MTDRISRAFLIIGAVVALFGAWMVFGPSPSDSSTAGEQTGEVSTQTSSDSSSPDGEQGAPSPPSASPDAPVETTVPGELSGAELNSLQLQTIPEPTTTTASDQVCDLSYQGVGVEMRPWGDVLLPYTPGYPTTPPGEVWDCTPHTVFGAAVAMAHAVYLEALNPATIPNIAVDNLGRAARIRNHPGGNPKATLGFGCSPIGWNWDGDKTWTLLHTCDQRDPLVSEVEMEWTDDRWWLVYPPTGELPAVAPPPGFEYYPYLGGGD